MWVCEHCGCQAIAADLAFCPQCFQPKEDDVPKVTSGGPSNGDEEPQEAPAPPKSAPKPPEEAEAPPEAQLVLELKAEPAPAEPVKADGE